MLVSGILADRRVAIVRESPRYSNDPPFHPSENVAEFPGQYIGKVDNPGFRAVRQALADLKLDGANWKTSRWNPFGQYVNPGETVFLKPNLVAHFNHGIYDGRDNDTDSLVTNGSVLRAVVDYVAKALDMRGTIIVGDCPIQGTYWDDVIHLTGLDAIKDYAHAAYPSIDFQLRDYRLGRASVENGRVRARIVDESERDKYVEVDLGKESLLVPIIGSNVEFGVPQYPRYRMRRAHTATTNLYLFHRDILDADFVVNLPKMKTHMKAGITCALKNFVGTIGHKDYLPHFRFGSPKNGGDEFPDGGVFWDLMWYFSHWDWELESGWRKRLYAMIAVFFAKLQRLLGAPRGFSNTGGGGWYGNDTLWRTILDIHRAFVYFDRDSRKVSSSALTNKKYFVILDGLVGGQKEGPLAPTPVESGVVLAGGNPLALDTVASTLMGFDWTKIPQLREGYGLTTMPLATFSPREIEVHYEGAVRSLNELRKAKGACAFHPPTGFRGRIECSM